MKIDKQLIQELQETTLSHFLCAISKEGEMVISGSEVSMAMLLVGGRLGVSLPTLLQTIKLMEALSGGEGKETAPKKVRRRRGVTPKEPVEGEQSEPPARVS